ncbi:MAG: hypothetical protein FJ149_02575 [Euryarchaeota archaeon]|nr:hypothetical protein [Euryarchaeota archaeon]
MRHIRAMACMLAGMFLLAALPLPSRGTNDPPSGGGDVTGDWTVTDTRSYSGVTINVAGNLIIQGGGSLTLSAVNLHINSASAGSPCRIEVRSGGRLYADNGTKIMTSTPYNFKFQFLAGSTGALSSTTISKVGVLGNEFGRGVYIGSDGVSLDGCTVQNGYEGIHINSSAPSVLNTTVKDCQYYGIYIEKAQPLVDNCTVGNNGHYGGTAGLYADETYSPSRVCRISNCTIVLNEIGAYLNSNAAVLFENNTVANSTARGLWIRLSDPTVRLNNITRNKENGIFMEQSNALIERNRITRNGQSSLLSSGIYVYFYSNPVIRDNLIGWNTDTGVHIRPQCAPALRDNNITFNTNIGVKLNYCGAARIEGNNISANYDGLNSLGSPPVIRGNVLWANQNDGLHADGGDLEFEGNTVTGAGAAGIHALNGARMLVGNCTFANYQWGISAETGASVRLVNGDFSNGFKEAFRCDGSSTLDWLVDSRSSIDGNGAGLRGNLTIVSGGRLSLANLRVDVSSSAAWTRQVELRPGGELLLESVNLTAYDPAWNYKFTSAGKLRVLNSSVEEMGWDAGGTGENGGLHIGGGSAYFYNSHIQNNLVGLVLRDASDVILEQCGIYGAQTGAVDARGSVLEARNSTVRGGSAYSLRLDQSSRAEMKVTQFDGGAVQLLDGPSVVNVYWYLKVNAEWASHDPLAGATVRLSDRQGQPVWTRNTDQAGATPWEEVREYSQTSAARTSFTPHTINVTTGPFSAERQVTVDQSLEYTFTFTDATAPELSITSPADRSFQNTRIVELRGTASDPDSGIRKVEVSDGSRWYDAETTDGWANWNYTFDLVPASYTLSARATNGAGNVSRSEVAISIDITAPILTVSSPAEGLLINRTPCPVDGLTSLDATASAEVNGIPVALNNTAGKLSGDLPLAEGQNLIVFTVADRAGNMNSTARNVTLDTVPPRITLELPPETYTNRQSIVVNGSTDGTQVMVDYAVADLTGGRFTRTVDLQGIGPSGKVIWVVAYDGAGNSNRTSLLVFHDTKPPTIKFTSTVPSPTNQASIHINGTTEPGATLTIQGIPVPVDAAGNFSHLYELEEGTNNISVSATDIAGNIQPSVLVFILDTVAPRLEVEAPLDGSRTYNISVDILGVTEPGAALTVNGEVVLVGLEGLFSFVEFPLLMGQNNITLTANDKAGNSRTVVIKVTRDEPLPYQPPQPVDGPAKGGLESLLPWILIILIIVGGVGAGAWAALGGRKQQKAPPRRPPGRAMSPVEARAARRGQGAPPRPRTAQELYGADYARKFSRPAAPSPWEQSAPPAAPQDVSWGAEARTAAANAPQAEAYEPPAEPYQAPAGSYQPPAEPYQAPAEEGEAPAGPAMRKAPQPVFGPARPPGPGEHPSAPAHPEAATKAVDSDIDALLKKIGDVTKKK